MRKHIDRELIEEALRAFFGLGGGIRGIDVAESGRRHDEARDTSSFESLVGGSGRRFGEVSEDNQGIGFIPLRIRALITIKQFRRFNWTASSQLCVLWTGLLASSLLDTARRRVDSMPSDLSKEAQRSVLTQSIITGGQINTFHVPNFGWRRRRLAGWLQRRGHSWEVISAIFKALLPN